jgi:hypothetical protein
LSCCLSFAVLGSIEAAPETSVAVGPLTYYYLQEGYSEGATVSGTILAEDLDGDGLIERDFGELYDITINWSGNSLVSSFSWVWSEHQISLRFLWDTEDPVLGGGRGGDYFIGVPPWQYHWRWPGADYSVVRRPTETVDLSTAPLVITLIPEPSSLTLLGLGMMASVVLRHAKALGPQ